jgi:large subunit ribosomal protein L13
MIRRQKTFSQKPADVSREWLLLDATNRSIGDIASEAATLIIGKNKPTVTPHVDGGDFVVIINAAKLSVSERKADQKIYYRHSGYVGSMKEEKLGAKMSRKPEEVITLAVKGMLPKNKLGPNRLARLRVFAGPEHDHNAQQPKEVTTNSRKGA